ncbi:MAG: hypothetical protein H6573_24095 [Lewinellaceae bacterium]|nr:hypothetical protein [Phaeodactylibacter sp.]MCB9350565.1 hypothetical protein [Lewinellaceae bacterium]
MKVLNAMAFLMIILFLYACAVPKNEQSTQEWLDKAEKPVYVQVHSFGGLTYNYRRYTLVDQNGKVFFTKDVRFILPDTIPGR